MKKMLSLLVLLMPIIVNGQSKYYLQGSWREIARKEDNNHYVRFRDTMKIEFLQNQKCIWQERDGHSYYCNYSADITGINIGLRFFNVLHSDANYLILGDMDGIYKFKRTKHITRNIDDISYIYTDNHQEKEDITIPDYDNRAQQHSSHKIITYYDNNAPYKREGSSSSEWHYRRGYNNRTNYNEDVYENDDVNTDRNYPNDGRKQPAVKPARKRGELTGNWREVTRLNQNNQRVNITDRIFIDFLGNNEYVWHKDKGFIYKGSYITDGRSIDLGMRYFSIVSNDGNYLVLNDGNATYEFEYYIPAAEEENIIVPEVYKPVRDARQLAGHWSVYKRTSNYRPNRIDYTRQLKMVDFYSDRNGIMGDFYSQRDADNAPSWFVDGYARNTQMLYLDGKDQRTFHIIKCEDNELIMEEDGVTYFFRQFR